MTNGTSERQQGTAKPGTELARDYLLSETRERPLLSFGLFSILCSKHPSISHQPGCFLPARLGSLGSLGKAGRGLCGCPWNKPGESGGARGTASGKAAALGWSASRAAVPARPPDFAVLSAGIEIPPALFSAFLTLSGNSCSNFNTHLLPEMRTRTSDSAEKSTIFTLSNLIYLETSLLEPAGFT